MKKFTLFRFLKLKKRRGQALVVLLVFVSIATVVIAAATMLILINTQAAGDFANGEATLRVAESGAENAVLKIIRNPAYSGETLTVDDGTVTISVSGTNPKTIVAIGVVGNFVRKVQVVGNWANDAFGVTSWSEIN